MNTAHVLILGTFVAILSTSAFAQDQLPGDTNTNYWIGASNAPVAPEQGNQQPRRLFTIGGLPVNIYTPVEPPYSPAMNRNLAADPLWAPGF